jgi:uncharacterized membrane protein YwaF
LTLGALAAVAVLLIAVLRRSRRAELPVRILLAALLAGGLAFSLFQSLPLHGHDWLDILPLHFCEMAVLVGVAALLTRARAAAEVLYFWGLTGTVIAKLNFLRSYE